MARVLVVDDEEGLRELFSEVLEDEGHEVVAVETAEAALGELARATFALLLTDLRLPGIDGLELVRRAKEGDAEMEAIVVTAHGSVDTAVHAMKLGALDYLQKPLSSPDELRIVVARALERRTLLRHRERASRAEPAAPPLTYGAPAMARIVEAVRKVAPTRATVLLTGESGTGKEVAARAIHAASDRAAGPFVAINCAALSDSLLESELFGHEKGAFTGATAQRRGRIELAEGGTLFLDEIGELRIELQAKLLRVLEARTFERLGGTRSLTTDARFIAATNRDLRAMSKTGAFREDLYHRVAVFPIELPPLRQRRQDVGPLADELLRRVGAELGRRDLRLTADARAQLEAHPLSGNVRELRNVLERAAILAEAGVVDVGDLWLEPEAPHAPVDPDVAVTPLVELERTAIERALAHTQGNRKRAAELLGIGLRTLYDKLKSYEKR